MTDDMIYLYISWLNHKELLFVCVDVYVYMCVSVLGRGRECKYGKMLKKKILLATAKVMLREKIITIIAYIRKTNGRS